MNKFSAPPMIIILDVLFAVLFVTILETSPNIKIILPKDKLPNNTVVISENDDEYINYFFNKNINQWDNYDNLPKAKGRYSSYIADTIKCYENEECKNIIPIENETKIILLNGDLSDRITGLISASCLSFPKRCSNVTYVIDKKGEVDIELLKKDYPFFKTIIH